MGGLILSSSCLILWFDNTKNSVIILLWKQREFNYIIGDIGWCVCVYIWV